MTSKSFLAVFSDTNRSEVLVQGVFVGDHIDIYARDHLDLIAKWPKEKVEVHETASAFVFLENPTTSATLKVETKEFARIRGHFQTSWLSKLKTIPIWPNKVIAGSGIVAGLVVAYIFLPGFLGTCASSLLTRPQSQRLFKSFGVASYPLPVLENSSEGVLKDVKSVFLKKTTLPSEEFRFFLVSDSLSNAITFPNGDVVLFCGLVKEAKSSEEVIGVLSHELGHVYHQHGVRHFVNQAVRGILSFAFSIEALDLVSSLGSLQFSRKQETEADEFAVNWLKENQLSSKGLLNFFKHHEKEPGWSKFFSTHPMSEDRIRYLQSQTDPKEINLLSPKLLENLKTACDDKREPEEAPEPAVEPIEI